MLIAQILVYSAMAYLALGVVFSAYFVLAGISDFDESAKDAGMGFKLIIFLGSIPFWPVIGWRILRGGSAPREKNAHREAAGESQ